MDTIRDGTFGLSNTNKLVRFYPGATGLKTGFTSGAGYCLSATAQREGMELIAVVMGAETSQKRNNACKQLLDHGFANYTLARPDPNAVIPQLTVILGAEKTVTPVAADDTPVLVKKSQLAGVKTQINVDPEVRAPVEAGQRLGTMLLTAEGQTLAEIPLVAPEAIARRTWWDVTRELLASLCFCEEPD